ncbi:ADP compounds hydrolase NudE [Candidatus Curculioniphilus buchneri]|uniref:ADP compounds hydrolase NudE n=1 Tax=Candidatus Curculioniphilus buchneri TaxID=690594 RepID=UPI00376F21B6
MDNHLKKPKIYHVDIIAKSHLFTIESVALEFSNGVQRVYERMKPSQRDVVMIVPIKNNQLLLIREYSAGIEDYELGFPKGLINPNEGLIEAANRELMEEIGFGAQCITFLKRLSMSPSYFSSTTNIVIAQELYPNRLLGDEPEPLSVVQWPVHHMLKLLDEPDFCEARNVSALFLTHAYFN